MRKLLNNPWIVAGLALTAILSILWSPDTATDSAAAPAYADTDPTALPDEFSSEFDDNFDTPASALAQRSLAELVAAIKVSDTVFDPFAPRDGELPAAPLPAESKADTTPEAPQRKAIVSAVWIQGPVALAVVNDRICAPGADIGDLHIHAIDAEGVWVSHPGGRDFIPVGNTLSYRGDAHGPSGVHAQTTLAHHES
ncbi:MAG: hypothetical protein D6781_10050 [Verrucomicrobia bacterium]|nr:MAG: hypothetical protein D6781_10050 [Verrucomicrobiota bacterium]